MDVYIYIYTYTYHIIEIAHEHFLFKLITWVRVMTAKGAILIVNGRLWDSDKEISGE